MNVVGDKSRTHFAKFCDLDIGLLGRDCRDGIEENVDLKHFGLLHVCSKDVGRSIARLVAQSKRLDSLVWSRHDLQSSCFRSTSKGGPEWGQVVGRVSVEAATGKVIEEKMTNDIPREMQHGKLPSGKTDLITYLVYVKDRWQARS